MKKVLLLVVTISLLFALNSYAQTANKTAKKVETAPVVKSSAIASDAISQNDLLKKVYAMPSSTVVALVNGSPITKGDLMYALWNAEATNTLNELINKKVMEEALLKEKIAVPPKELNDAINNILKSNNIATLDELALKYNISPDKIKSEVKTELSIQKYIDKNLKYNAEDLNKYMKPSHILIKFDANIEDNLKRDEDAKKKIDDIYVKVKAGEDFAKLAKEYSDDGSKTNGGLLGWVDGNVSYVPEFKDAMLKLKAGEVSEPVKTAYGYHIIKMNAKGDTATGSDLAEIKQKEKQKKSGEFVNAWYNKIRQDIPVDNKLIVTPEVKPAPKAEAKPVK